MTASADKIRELAEEQQLTPTSMLKLEVDLDAGDNVLAAVFLLGYCNSRWREEKITDEEYAEILKILDLDEQTTALIKTKDRKAS